MPNHCTNNIVITGSNFNLKIFWDALKKFKGYEENEEGEISIFSSFLPMPEELQNATSPGDSPNWYDWAIENWGSKWGDYDTDLDFDGDRITGCYTSAWGPCNEGIKTVSALFPKLTFEVNYHELGMMFIGAQVCENGEEIAEWSRNMTKEDYVELGYDEEE
jgi:hypothetical protein